MHQNSIFTLQSLEIEQFLQPTILRSFEPRLIFREIIPAQDKPRYSAPVIVTGYTRPDQIKTNRLNRSDSSAATSPSPAVQAESGPLLAARRQQHGASSTTSRAAASQRRQPACRLTRDIGRRGAAETGTRCNRRINRQHGKHFGSNPRL